MSDARIKRARKATFNMILFCPLWIEVRDDAVEEEDDEQLNCECSTEARFSGTISFVNLIHLYKGLDLSQHSWARLGLRKIGTKFFGKNPDRDRIFLNR